MSLKLGVIGYPIGQSKSPIIHTYWMKKYGLDGTYETIAIKPDELTQGVQKLIDGGYQGFNVTIPHKEAMLDICDEVDDVATAIGAVNTVSIRDGKLFGTNTDSFGFIENLKQHADYDLKGTALVLGAGGAARAIIYGLLENGISQILLTNRTRSRAEKLKPMAPDKISVEEWDKRKELLKDIDLLVNTTSLGMDGQPKLGIDLSNLLPSATVCDIVYKPLMTDLLGQAKNKENQIVTGIGMLLHQARPAFEQWTGILPDVDQNLEDMVLA